MKKLSCMIVILILCLSLSGCPMASTNISSGINKERYKMQSTDFDNTCINWYFIPNNQFQTPQVNDTLRFRLSDYNAIYNGPTVSKNKSLYLTFDEGYENGYTEQILDILKEKDVKAIFFVTSHYICYVPDTVKRMVTEGHMVANHTKHHYSMPSVTYSTKVFNKELKDVEDRFKNLTGEDLSNFFRPPMGQYSEKSLAMTKDLGYQTIFWSFAYGDYEPNNQPSPAYARQYIFNHLHDGSIILLHAISKTNASILGDVIDDARNSGYEFYLLPQ